MQIVNTYFRDRWIASIRYFTNNSHQSTSLIDLINGLNMFHCKMFQFVIRCTSQKAMNTHTKWKAHAFCKNGSDYSIAKSTPSKNTIKKNGEFILSFIHSPISINAWIIDKGFIKSAMDARLSLWNIIVMPWQVSARHDTVGGSNR